MKASPIASQPARLIAHLRSIATGVAVAAVLSTGQPAIGAEGDPRPLMEKHQLEEHVRHLQSGPGGLERARHPGDWLGRHWLSSQQVKTLAKAVPNEDARLELAVALYPRTLDPENFYEVYDAFASFSKAFRLHDRIHGLPAGTAPPPAPVAVVPLSDDEFKDIVRVIRAEGFEDKKKAIARQVIAAKGRFLSRQVRDLLRQFAFEDTRLELAMFAYDYTLDPENYYSVHEVFSFSDNKERLARHIESRQRAPARR
jgi:hypothetical protein